MFGDGRMVIIKGVISIGRLLIIITNISGVEILFGYLEVIGRRGSVSGVGLVHLRRGVCLEFLKPFSETTMLDVLAGDGDECLCLSLLMQAGWAFKVESKALEKWLGSASCWLGMDKTEV